MVLSISSILVALFVLTFVVTIHELGHFLLAKKEGVGVSEFAIGMGPKIFGKQKGDTLYSIRALPVGGYVKFENDDEFRQSKPLSRFLILFAGPFFNFILGYVVLVIVGMLKGFSFFKSFQLGGYVFWKYSMLILNGLYKLFSGLIPAKELSGPVGIIDTTSKITQSSMVDSATHAVHISSNGIVMLLIWLAVISINLGIMNLLPIPILDGGRIFLVLLEGFKIIKPSKRLEEIFSAAGVIIILAFFVFTLFNDIGRIFTRLF